MILLLLLTFCFATENDGEWNGYKKIECSIDTYKGFVVAPKFMLKYQNSPWIWRTEFFDHEPQVDIILLNKGFHLAYINVQNMYGAPIALNIMDRFYSQAISKFNLSIKVALEGLSRGGLYAFNWAARNPDKVAVIYGDAPVLDFKSWPAGIGKSWRRGNEWNELLKVYNFTEEEALSYKFNPIDNLLPLINAHIPIICICGGSDTVVPFDENTGILEEKYRKLNGYIKVIVKSECDHHPHSLKDPKIIVDFIIGCALNSSTPSNIKEYISYCYYSGENDRRNTILSILLMCSVIILFTGISVLIYYYRDAENVSV